VNGEKGQAGQTNYSAAKAGMHGFSMALAQELARRAALALDNTQLFGATKRHNVELEERVQERTEALHTALEQLQQNNVALANEIAERQAAENRFRSLLQAAPDATIIVNGQEKGWVEKTISFDEVVALAFNPVPEGPNVLITVSYRRGPEEKAQGTLTKGQSVEVKHNMRFDVTATDKS